VRAADFAAALARITPSITRGWEAELAPAAWDDIGGLAAVKARLCQAVEWPLAHAGAFARLGLAPPRGVLLHGPPGCCKTTLARAAATASRARLQARPGRAACAGCCARLGARRPWPSCRGRSASANTDALGRGGQVSEPRGQSPEPGGALVPPCSVPLATFRQPHSSAQCVC